MPIYEYRCESCGKELEKIQKISDPLLTDCPACGQSSLVKKVSASAFRLKGEGWYETDFKTGKRKNVAGDGGEERKSTDESTGKEGKDSKAASDKTSGKSDSGGGTADSAKKPAAGKTSTSGGATGN